MSENIMNLLKENAALVGENLQQFFRILAAPGDFISSIKHSSSDQLVPASIFAALMSLLNLALHLPLFRLLGVEAKDVSYFVADTVITYAFWFIYGSCFHLVAKIFRAHGNYDSTMNSFLYLTAFFPVLTAISIPAELVMRRQLVEGGDTTSIEFQLSVLLGLSSSIPALISIALFFLLYIWYLIALGKVFRIVHDVGRAKSAVIVSVGFIIWMLISFFIEIPTFQMFWKAYQTQGA